jgi:hypothetical protein
MSRTLSSSRAPSTARVWPSNVPSPHPAWSFWSMILTKSHLGLTRKYSMDLMGAIVLRVVSQVRIVMFFGALSDSKIQLPSYYHLRHFTPVLICRMWCIVYYPDDPHSCGELPGACVWGVLWGVLIHHLRALCEDLVRLEKQRSIMVSSSNFSKVLQV